MTHTIKNKCGKCKKMKKHKPCFCDDCLKAYYHQPCKGCPEGHNSFWQTVVESPQWKEWRKYAFRDHMLYDFPEVEEGGIISPKHFQDFIEYTIKQHAKSIRF